MSAKIPYMLSSGLIPKVLEKIQKARRPDRFTQDYLSTKLGHSGGSAMPVIPLLKKMGFLASDGSPTSRYDQFRNSETSGVAVAEGMKEAFHELFDRNEYVYDMPREKITSLVVEVTGSAKGDRTTQAIVSTFFALKEYADFESDFESEGASTQNQEPEEETPTGNVPTETAFRTPPKEVDNVDFKVSYTINLNLPETTNPDVFNAIFRSLKEHLLKE